MTARRFGVALMALGVVLAATGTVAFGALTADRASPVSAVADDPGPDDNYFDTADNTKSWTTIDSSNDTVVWYLYNNFHEQLVGDLVAVVGVEPVNASQENTTANDDAVVVVAGDFDEGDAITVDSKAAVSLACNPHLTETIDADHHVTVRVEVSGASGATVTLTRTVTEHVECNL